MKHMPMFMPNFISWLVTDCSDTDNPMFVIIKYKYVASTDGIDAMSDEWYDEKWYDEMCS